MDKYDQVDKLKKLLDEGAITEEEFEKEKEKLLSNKNSGGSQFWGMKESDYCMLMHFSQLAGWIIPFAGLVVPIVMWATAKDYSKVVDNHGRIIFNWMLSALIYFFVSAILIFLIIGFPLMLALAIVSVVFAVMGGLKASNGVEWDYPLSIPFFKRDEPKTAIE